MEKKNSGKYVARKKQRWKRKLKRFIRSKQFAALICIVACMASFAIGRFRQHGLDKIYYDEAIAEIDFEELETEMDSAYYTDMFTELSEEISCLRAVKESVVVICSESVATVVRVIVVTSYDSLLIQVTTRNEVV